MTTPEKGAIEIGRVLGPETARPSDEEMAEFAYQFWKARGCPQWLWGGLAIRRPLTTRAPRSSPSI